MPTNAVRIEFLPGRVRLQRFAERSGSVQIIYGRTCGARMIQEIPTQPLPDWIARASLPLREFAIRRVLADSVYYPACAFDGAPAKYLAGNFHSFVYVDYGVGRERVLENLNGFRGYHCAAVRDIAACELAPNGWTPQFRRSSDGIENPRLDVDWVRPPFGLWSIQKRMSEYGPDHGPDAFSLLYIGGDAVATFQALYHGNRVSPAVVAVIQPGTGFGGNWTNFEDADGIFARSVLGNLSGSPGYLLFGGWGDGKFYRRPCWPIYGESVCALHGRLRLWRKSA